MHRRDFFRSSGAALAGSSLVALGFSPAPVLAEARQFKLARSTETRSTCPYCSVGCGVILHSRGDPAKPGSSRLVHIEGDPDHPVNRGTLCAKGAGLLDFVRSPDRLTHPEVREPGAKEWQRIGWDEALGRIARLMKADRDANFIVRNAQGLTVNRWPSTGLLCAAAGSSESAYLTHKAMRAAGMVLIDQPSRLGHAPTAAALASTFGRGAMTNHWQDIAHADVVLVMGGNAAEAHPCGFKWVLEAKRRRQARLVVVDPRYTRSAALADLYAPIRAGTDIAFLGGVIHHLLSKNTIQTEYVRHYTNAPFIVGAGFRFEDGLFSGYDADKRRYDGASWAYELGADGLCKTDPTMQHERCVLQVLKRHYARYTPDMVSRITGTPKDAFLTVCDWIASTAVPGRAMTVLHAAGWAQHAQGAQTVRAGAIVQLLLGNVGVAGGGMNALGGHGNGQGLADLGLRPDALPGYLSLARASEQTLDEYYRPRAVQPLRPGQMSYWRNYPKFFVSLQKAWWGEAATKANDWAFHHLPKVDDGKAYDLLQAFELMGQGKLNGYICQGSNPLASLPDTHKTVAALSKLEFLVTIDPLATETSEFWRRRAGHDDDVDPETIRTTVFRLPAACFAEQDGSFVNASRWLQWHARGVEPPGEARPDVDIVAGIFLRLRDAYVENGGAFPHPIVDLTWDYKHPARPSAEELAMECNGRALADVADLNDRTKVIARAGEQIGGFGALRDDGSTASGCWVWAGMWTPAGNQTARRDDADSQGLGQAPGWAWSWPANRRVLYNAASVDPATGAPWAGAAKLVAFDGGRWSGADVPDMRPDADPAAPDAVRPFIMNAEGVARLYAPTGLADGPLPEHYEPFESPLARNPLHPKSPRARVNPVARVFRGDRRNLGSAKEFPYVATSYRLAEHFNHWTKSVRSAAALEPRQFVEIGVELGKALGIASGDTVQVTSSRGFIRAAAVVSRRIASLDVDGRRVHTVGLPAHWGPVGLARPGFLVNTLTASVGDASTHTPAAKSFTVNIEKVVR